jgi:hypothetical protein
MQVAQDFPESVTRRHYNSWEVKMGCCEVGIKTWIFSLCFSFHSYSHHTMYFFSVPRLPKSNGQWQ